MPLHYFLPKTPEHSVCVFSFNRQMILMMNILLPLQRSLTQVKKLNEQMCGIYKMNVVFTKYAYGSLVNVYVV